MSDIVQRYPFGVPDLFGLKAGQTPATIGAQIQLTAPVLEYFLLNGRESLNSAPLAASIGVPNFSDMVVPDGQLWYVWHISVNLSAVLAAGTIRYRAAIQYGSTSVQAVSEPTAPAVGQNGWCNAKGPFLVSPGGRLGAIVEDLTLGPPSLVVSAVFTRIRV